MLRGETKYQLFLILLGLLTIIFIGVFFFREAYPEYRIYQEDYIALEKFRSKLTGEPITPFQIGVKQIVIERDDKGPPIIDRCTSCHVALQIEAFSKTRIAHDVNGAIIYDEKGIPRQEHNPNYIFALLDAAIQKETNPTKRSVLESLKKAKVGEHTYDVEKVLMMHPLIGRETRPFEFHPIDDYGCTSCHGGNGRGLVTDRAHGPVFDGEYEREEVGFVPQFLEKDEKNDPKFSRVFNGKPGARLLFQTTPLLVGALMQSKCMSCHVSSKDLIQKGEQAELKVQKEIEKELFARKKSLLQEENHVASLLFLDALLKQSGEEKTIEKIGALSSDLTLNSEERGQYGSMEKFLKTLKGEKAEIAVDRELLVSLGSNQTIKEFQKEFNPKNPLSSVQEASKKSASLQGELGRKRLEIKTLDDLLKHSSEMQQNPLATNKSERTTGALKLDIDRLTEAYQRGEALFISQACYACHRIAGFSRGGVGPELTRSGDGYPWFIKESIVWPQADLKTSTMPNVRLDHEELEALVTYLLGQTSTKKVSSPVETRVNIQAWESGLKMPFEKPVTKEQIQDTRYALKVFALEGCASCHRLDAYTSDVGYRAEKGDGQKTIQEEKAWFRNLFPETITGKQLVQRIEEHGKEIDAKIVDNLRKGSILEEIEKERPDAIESLYSNFRFALRAKDNEGEAVSKPWKKRVRLVLKMFVQEYGLGRNIGPIPNWSGVYRSDKWLMEHFKSPTSVVPRSIMPRFPFDDTKFYALTTMLDKVAIERVRKEAKEERSFDPERAFFEYCADCHGERRLGNGPVATWIYPIPKNLSNPEFMRNLTKERAFNSIMHGVKGTPMPPWGELGDGKPMENNVPVMTEEEIHKLVDWLFDKLPGESVIKSGKDLNKWKYDIKDVEQDLKNEGRDLKETIEEKSPLSFLPRGEGYIASLSPMPVPLENRYFDVKEGAPPDEKLYYIKQKYYTETNISAGKRFFIENCSPCHGTEGDGSGLRAEAMSDAKPRMLTNYDWISSRDDLRLLRSIKYGVPGTSMTPWGDLTSALQRMQLVIFIRSLSLEKKWKKDLQDAVYQAFDKQDLDLERNGSKEGEKLQEKREQLFLIRKKALEVGDRLLNLKQGEKALQLYIEFLSANDKKKREDIQQQLKQEIQNNVSSLDATIKVQEGKLPSIQRDEALTNAKHDKAAWMRLEGLLYPAFFDFDHYFD